MEIISYKEAPFGSKYVAEIEVYYDRIFYRRIRITLSKNGHHFINLPVYGEEDGRGGKKWIQFWEWPKDKDVEFKRQCLEAVQPYLNKQSPGVQSTVPSQSASLPPQASYPGTYQPDLSDCPF
jgi:hypothetical protein